MSRSNHFTYKGFKILLDKDHLCSGEYYLLRVFCKEYDHCCGDYLSRDMSIAEIIEKIKFFIRVINKDCRCE